MLELNAQKLQMEGQKQAGQLQLKQAEIAAKASQQHLNDQAQAAIAIRGQNMNQELGMAKIDLAAHQAHQESLRKQAESDARVKQMRTGGALDK
jgi:hypothetical protein